MRRIPLIPLLMLLLVLGARGGHSTPTGVPLPAGGLCRAAIAVVEREASLPGGLLQAIGRVESNRRDPTTGAWSPWPWTINVEGTGYFFQTREEAIAAVRQHRARGATSIDIGCMQINLRHHPTAFASLEEGFDPLANARYAARFLRSLWDTRRDWMQAAANYHSNTPEFANAYRARVAAAWPEEARLAGSHPAYVGPGRGASALPFGSRGGNVMAGNVPPAAPSAERGRGLDAYRTMAIPPATRAVPMVVARR
ncbi:lytic transglycosylase domain-containing protein [Humitalea sp. 24SJ18S-53]|uniref:lytic transglycosylase domain-containing protein n=1 Tax=Humitalea sp. 24SJ18S-53 TaxID=3422307 RepID=UPI003D673D73